MADISKITVGGVTGNIADTTARATVSSLETAQRVLAASTQQLAAATTPTLTSDEFLSRRKTYYKLTAPDTYTALVLGTDYDAQELSCSDKTIYERSGAGTHTYVPAETAGVPNVFEADHIYSWYRADIKSFVILEPVASDPGIYQYVPGTTLIGDKPYEVYLEDPYVYTATTDTLVSGSKVYCLRDGSGTALDPYVYRTCKLTAGRPFAIYEYAGYSVSQMVAILNPLIAPHKQTAS